MGIISILPEHVACQIAAGEVVEGPNSIIKELVENSVDAGATKVFIELSKNFLRLNIIDDGCGMSPDDLSLAFKKHATSKIKTIDDVFKISTNGFRGEALASVAAVSKLTCISKRKEDDFASKIYLENGEESISQTGAMNGTNILVDDLFFNTPARLKFLKSDRKERNLVIDTVKGLALANLGLAFTLKIDSKEILRSTGLGDLKTAISELFTSSVAKSIVKVEGESLEMKLVGYASNTYVSRSDKRGIFTFVNGRYVPSYILRSAIESVYKELLAPGKYPIAAIFIDLPFEQVDVNVHPNKREVKFENTNRIYNFISDNISKALADSFYESSQSFQPSFKDHELRSVPSNDDHVQENFAEKLVEMDDEMKEQVRQVSIDNVSEREVMDSFSQDTYKPQFHNSFQDFSDVLPELPSSSGARKFVSRFGAVDISILDTSSPKTLMSSQGNKTSFDIVAKSDQIEKSVLLKGNFVGENWIKELYFNFLHELAKKILDREIEEINFGKEKKRTSSRPNVKPNKDTLEKIWKRDNYTCVYCQKALLNPDLVKEKLPEAEDAKLLNSHLASYDHHLPASKFGELNTDERNLYASCQACNIKKNDSLASKTWTPNVSNSWTEARTIAGIKFEKPE